MWDWASEGSDGRRVDWAWLTGGRAPQDGGETPLHLASGRGHEAAIRTLLATNAQAAHVKEYVRGTGGGDGRASGGPVLF